MADGGRSLILAIYVFDPLSLSLLKISYRIIHIYLQAIHFSEKQLLLVHPKPSGWKLCC